MWAGFLLQRGDPTLWISFWDKQHVMKSWRIKSGSNVGWWECFRCEKNSVFSDTNYKFVWCKYFVSDSSGSNTAALTVCHWGMKEVCPWSRSTAECYLWGWTLGTESCCLVSGSWLETMLLSRLIILSMKIDVDVCSLQAATVKLEVYDEIAKAEVDGWAY